MNKILVILVLGISVSPFGFAIGMQSVKDSTVAHACLENIGGQIWVDGRTFTMGDNEGYKEEGPAHKVILDGFWIDMHEVTNIQFSEFVDKTGYITVAEREPNLDLLKGVPSEMLKPGGVVFTPLGSGGSILHWWSYIPGANWRYPEGPKSSINGKEYYPVVQIAFEDAQAYAAWVGRELPTEAQYELASRSRLDKEKYAWGGKDLAPKGKHKANTWQGFFPMHNSGEDGYTGVAPVGCFDTNEYGAYDLIGNVWEWTGNWYAPIHDPEDSINPKGPEEVVNLDKKNEGYPMRVIKGGSYLCAPNYCMRYRPAARQAQDTGLGSTHIGFRTVLNM